MSCELAQSTAHGYFDDELDAMRAAEFERHLEKCAECQASLERMESLRSRLQKSELYEHASGHLREQVRKQLALDKGITRLPAMRWRRWFFAPAFAVLAVAAAVSIVLLVIQPPTRTATIASAAIDAHVRSLQPGHLTDVESTDQHTVKPWFDGKLAFIPPVTDYSGQGFPLQGGRLDVVDANSVAALVYGRRKHVINLFVWPARGAEKIADGSGSRQGYNWAIWRSGDMRFCLVSDVSAGDLRELRKLIENTHTN